MTPRNPYLCVMVVAGLIVIALALIFTSAILDINDRSAPRAWDAILGAVVGALASLLVTVPARVIDGNTNKQHSTGANNP